MTDELIKKIIEANSPNDYSFLQGGFYIGKKKVVPFGFPNELIALAGMYQDANQEIEKRLVLGRFEMQKTHQIMEAYQIQEPYQLIDQARKNRKSHIATQMLLFPDYFEIRIPLHPDNLTEEDIMQIARENLTQFPPSFLYKKSENLLLKYLSSNKAAKLLNEMRKFRTR